MNTTNHIYAVACVATKLEDSGVIITSSCASWIGAPNDYKAMEFAKTECEYFFPACQSWSIIKSGIHQIPDEIIKEYNVP